MILIALSFFISSHGTVIAPMPWYLQLVLVPALTFAFLGLDRSGSLGRWIGIVSLLVWAYVAAASWVVKLIPMYGGFEQGHGRLRQLLKWYLESGAQRDSILSNLCPVPARVLYLLLIPLLACLLWIALRLPFHLASDRAAHSSR